jgi:hypothetical protein
MPKTARTFPVYDFTAFSRRTPNVPLPGDRLDAQFRQHADAIGEIQRVLDQLQLVPTIDLEALAAKLEADIAAKLADLSQAVFNAVAVAGQARDDLGRMRQDAAYVTGVADVAEARVAQAVAQVLAMPAPPAPTLSNAALGPNTGGPYAADVLGATATAADYADVAINWAEYMPTGSGTDTIPGNILAINAISGDHWSSRWWANRSANAFGMLAWWYMGAWPSPGPPTTPVTPTGQPIPLGAMFFNTSLGAMMAWNGSTWVQAYAPGKATTSSLYYLAAAGQTVFPFATPDRAGKTFAFNQAAPEGLQAWVNGVRLEPTFDFTVDTVASSVTFLRALTLNAVVAFDLLTPVAQLTASGTVNTVLLNPIVPDGVKTAFTGLTVASNGHPANVAKNEELSVSVDGVIQQPGAAYNAAAATITFAEAPAANANIFILWFGPANP